MNMPDYSLIGKRIKERRSVLNMTQEKLAETAGIGIQHVSKIENGSTKLSLPCIVAVANALETTVDYLLLDNIVASKPDIIREAEFSIFEDCTASELYILSETVKTLKQTLRKTRPPDKE